MRSFRNYQDYFVQALKLRRMICQDYLKVWRLGVDVLLTPVTLSDAPLYSEFIQSDSRAQSAQQVRFLIQPKTVVLSGPSVVTRASSLFF